jgi:general secretion pathway protein D
MDLDVPSGHGRLNAIFLRYIEAEEAAENISKLLAKRAAKEQGSAAISIQAVQSSNAILVDATPGDFDVVSRLIDQLDQPPEQVHIDVKILEVTERDGKDIGVSFASLEQPSSVGDSVVQGAVALTDSAGLLSAVQNGIFPNGISFGVSTGTRLDADGNLVSTYPGIVNINALISSGKLKVLSETSLQSENNQEATVRIVDDIPILTSVIEGGAGTSRDVIQNIERTDVGIKLTITPHVIPQTGAVRMILAPSIEAIIDAGPTETPFTPTIAKREVTTTVTVDNGRSAVIAGLTRHDSREQIERVPILGSIPLLGVLFRRTRIQGDRTDLLIIVTPHIVTEHAAADATKARWEQMTGLREEDLEHAARRDPEESR